MGIEGNIDYARYSQAELNEALESIRRDAYPNNYRNLIAEISKRKRAPLVRQALRSRTGVSISTDGNVDYSKYNRVELAQAAQSIDRHRYPRNHENLTNRLSELGPEPTAPAPMPASSEKGGDRGPQPYVPNRIPLLVRLVHLIASVGLIAYGAYGLLSGDLYIPGRRSEGIHLVGLPAILVFLAILCASAVMISVVADHYDRRDNERRYSLFAMVLDTVAWVLILAALGLHLTGS